MSVDGGRIVVRVEGKDIGLSDLLARINSQMNQAGSAARTYASQISSIDPIAQRSDRSLASYAQALARNATAAGDNAGAQQILAQALQQITPATTTATNVQTQLQQSINKSAQEAEKQSRSFTTTASGLQTLIGGYFVATRVISAFGDVIAKGNELEKTLTTFRVLSGSQEQYQKNLQLAREQQDKFGGSLNDTVEGMASFANLSKRTGVNIAELTNTARALAIIDPAQGFKGAGIALKEFDN